MSAYTHRDVSRILKIPSSRLRYWERTALVRPSAAVGSQPAYGFRDLVGLKAVVALRRSGVPLTRIRRSVERLRERLPELDAPLGALREWAPGSGRVVVRHGGGLLEPDGQLVLDFEAVAAGEGALELRPAPARGEVGPPAPSALDWFERGCDLDTDPRTAAEAEAAYRRALELDPGFADAWCNLGTLHYNQGRRDPAERAFRQALEAEPHHVEAHFNLASLLEEVDRDESALRHLKAAIAADPLYAEAQLSLALLYEKLALRRRARAHWRRYLQLEPRGSWADVARGRLRDGDS